MRLFFVAACRADSIVCDKVRRCHGMTPVVFYDMNTIHAEVLAPGPAAGYEVITTHAEVLPTQDIRLTPFHCIEPQLGHAPAEVVPILCALYGGSQRIQELRGPGTGATIFGRIKTAQAVVMGREGFDEGPDGVLFGGRTDYVLTSSVGKWVGAASIRCRRDGRWVLGAWVGSQYGGGALRKAYESLMGVWEGAVSNNKADLALKPSAVENTDSPYLSWVMDGMRVSGAVETQRPLWHLGRVTIITVAPHRDSIDKPPSVRRLSAAGECQPAAPTDHAVLVEEASSENTGEEVGRTAPGDQGEVKVPPTSDRGLADE